jgi:hypothetical protein
MKRCSKCKGIKDENDFYASNRYTCKECVDLRTYKHRLEHRGESTGKYESGEVKKLLLSFSEFKREPEEYRNKQSKIQLKQNGDYFMWSQG